MRLEILIGAVAKRLRPTGSEIRETCDESFGRQGTRTMEMNRGNLWFVPVGTRMPIEGQLENVLALRTSSSSPFRLISSAVAWYGVETTTR